MLFLYEEILTIILAKITIKEGDYDAKNYR